MTIAELADLLLTRLYDLAQVPNGYAYYHNTTEIAKELGVTDTTLVHTALDYLHKEELATVVFDIMDRTKAKITGTGAVLVEHGGNTGIIRQYRDNPQAVVATIAIHGDVFHSNIAAASLQADQR